MKLKTFDQLSSATRTNYSVYKKGTWKSGNITVESVIECFVVDYCDEDRDFEKLGAQLLKKEMYIKKGAEVVNVSVSAKSGKHGALGVTIEI